MAQNATIRPQQIERARKLLQDLPEKEDRKTRLEAAELLERDFRKAKEKGYNPRELSQMLKNEGIIIPAYLIKRFFAENGSSSTPQKYKSWKINGKTLILEGESTGNRQTLHFSDTLNIIQLDKDQLILKKGVGYQIHYKRYN